MKGLSDKIDISVLIATYNRANDLNETLKAMCLLDRKGISVEFVVIDNNSSDNTRQIVESYQDRLPLRYLFEPKAGKNCALNKALNEVELGEIVVFTDDDVTPSSNWLKEIKASCKRNPEHDIGGGKIVDIWPDGQVPYWLPFAKGINRGANLDLGNTEIEFPRGRSPWGPNLWIRRQLFDNGIRYNESIGPSPNDYAKGSEVSLLMVLAQQGHRMVYCPYSIIYHRLQESLAKPKGIKLRSYSFGKGQARLKGYNKSILHEKHHFLWWLMQLAAIGYAITRYFAAYFSFSKGKRIGKSLEPISDIAYHIELLQMDFQGKEGICCNQND